ncbi:MAG: DNA polymerase III subunit gamma/tau [candidate division Zixibacteria bacterium]|nr:DNA polymerase III subunit gamma/tau [candidate division Zixibacteria bacterium]
MAYEVTARRWRPQEFDRVIGQEHVTTTLKNAIQTGQIAHAYLFAGPRGVGKTTTARILAKALNCVNGPTITPCNTCSFCREISAGRSVDVLEIDGASNNKVEQIRSQLLESVKYTPSQGRHKIYIIDEVHMLTREAFNALLKTLEEPPAHVYFIFATTDPQKVLPTILSRCQRFDFRRIPGKTIVDHLAMIGEKSGYSIDREALAVISRRADGSMRDAESLFDQVTAFGGGRLSAHEVASLLGMVEQDIYFELMDAVACRDTGQGIRLIHRIIHEGYNLDEVALGILEHLRNLLMIKAAPDAQDLLEEDALDLERYRRQAAQFQIDDLLRLSQIATQTEEAIRTSALPRIQLETGVVRMIRMESSVLLTDVLTRLSELAQRIEIPEKLGENEPIARATVEPATVSVPLVEKIVSTSIPSPVPTAPERPVVPPKTSEPKPKTSSLGPSVSAVTTEPRPTEKPLPTTEITLQRLIQDWPSILETIKGRRIALGNFLAAAMIAGYQEDTITLAFATQHEFHKQQAEKKENGQLVQEIFSERIGRAVRLSYIVTDTPPEDSPPPLLPAEPLQAVNSFTMAKRDPTVKRLLDAFDGQIVGG